MAIIGLLSLNGLLALAATIYAFTLNSRSEHIRLEYVLATAELANERLGTEDKPGFFIYDLGLFTRETWACEARAFPHFNANLGGVMSRACDLGIGARWLSLFIFLAATGLFTVILMDHRGGRYFMQSWKRRAAIRDNTAYA